MYIFILICLFIIVYFYASIKVKKIIKIKNFKLNHSSLKYCMYLLAIYSIIPMSIIFIIGKIITNKLIKNFVFNNNLNLKTNISYQATINSIKKLSNLSDPSIIINKGYANLSFYVSNNKLLDIYNKYKFFNLVSDIALLCLAFIISLFIINKIIKKIKQHTNFQSKVEKFVQNLLFFCSLIAVITTVAIIFCLLFESLSFFNKIPILNFLFGTKWTPENSSFDPLNSFGIMPLLSGTFLIATIAIVVALIISVPAAIYMAEYIPSKIRLIIKPILEILAGIPTIVYGFFASLTFSPLLVKFFSIFNLNASSEAAITAGITIGIMIIPFISSITDDVLTAIPKTIKEAGFGLGSMRYQVINKILMPIALPGIAGAVLLALSRAIGETMIVVMVSGLTANLTFNPLESVTTITTQIVSLAQGDQEASSIVTLSLFALGLSLFFITLLLNLISFWIIKKFQKTL